MVISLLLLSPATSPTTACTSLLDISCSHHQCLDCRMVLDITLYIYCSTPPSSRISREADTQTSGKLEQPKNISVTYEALEQTPLLVGYYWEIFKNADLNLMFFYYKCTNRRIISDIIDPFLLINDLVLCKIRLVTPPGYTD